MWGRNKLRSEALPDVSFDRSFTSHYRDAGFNPGVGGDC